MKLDLRKFKIEKTADRKGFRPAIHCAYLDAEEGVIVTTNSYALAVVSVDLEEGDTTGPIPLAAIDASRKNAPRKGDASIGANGSVTVAIVGGKMTLDRPDDNFPKWKELLDQAESDKRVFEVSLSPRYLFELAEAMGCPDAVTLKVAAGPKAILVDPLSGDGERRGLLMPVKVK